jgi:hypothetical protein
MKKGTKVKVKADGRTGIIQSANEDNSLFNVAVDSVMLHLDGQVEYFKADELEEINNPQTTEEPAKEAEKESSNVNAEQQ